MIIPANLSDRLSAPSDLCADHRFLKRRILPLPFPRVRVTFPWVLRITALNNHLLNLTYPAPASQYWIRTHACVCYFSHLENSSAFLSSNCISSEDGTTFSPIKRFCYIPLHKQLIIYSKPTSSGWHLSIIPSDSLS